MSVLVYPLLDCQYANITLDQIIKNLIRKDAEGNGAMNTVEVDPADEPELLVNCDNTDGSIRSLYALSIVLDADGLWAMKIIKSSI